jgi:hypothetical protein
MRRARQVLIGIILAATTAATLVWIDTMPHRPHRLYRAVPIHARWVSRHLDLAGRDDAWTRHPLTVRAAEAMGYAPDDWRAWTESAAFRGWLERLCPEETVVAGWTSHETGEWVWMASSWIGARSARFRWALQAGRVPGVQPAGDYAGRRLWEIATGADARGARLFFALEEGILIAAWAAQPRELCRALDAYDGTMPRHPEAPLLREAAAPDAAWWMPRGGPAQRWTLQLTEWTDRRIALAAQAVGWDGMTASSFPGDAPASERLAAAWGSSPELILAADAPWLLRRLPVDAPLPAEFRALFEAQLTGPGAVAVFGTPLWGRWFGLRVPGVAVLTDLRDAPAWEVALHEAKDRINARTDWGLIVGADPLAEGVRIFEVSGEGLYGSLPAGERAAYAVRGDGLWLAMSADTLRGLIGPAALTNGVQERRARALSTMPWLAALSTPAPVRGWVDLERAPRTLRTALGLADLRQIAAGAPPDAPARARIRAARAGVDAVEGFSELGFRAWPGDGMLELEVWLDGPADGVREDPES